MGSGASSELSAQEVEAYKQMKSQYEESKGSVSDEQLFRYLKAIMYHKVPKRFVVCVDGSSHGRDAGLVAASMLDHEAGDTCHILHVTKKDGSEDVRRNAEGVKEFLDNELTALVPKERHGMTQLEKDGDKTTKQIISDWANGELENNPGQILVTGFVGRKAPDEEPTVLGSCSDVSIRTYRGTSMVIKKGKSTPFVKGEVAKIVVAVDGTPGSHHAFETACAVARQGDEVHALHIAAAEDVGERGELKSDAIVAHFEAALKATGIKGTVTVQENVAGEDVASQICAWAEGQEAKLLVVGADGVKAYIESRTPALGSVSDGCVKKAKMSVAISQLRFGMNPTTHA